MIDYAGITNTINTEQNIDRLREAVRTALDDIEQKMKTLTDVDPLDDPAYKRVEVDRARGQLGSVGLEVVRSIGQDAVTRLNALNALNVQIERAKSNPRARS